MKIYHLKSCDTCRKAIKAIQADGHDPELIDVRADGVSRGQLEAFEAALGYDALVNKRSTTWRSLDDSAKYSLSKDSAIDLLVEHPTLMKRPVIEADGAFTIGWTKDIQAKYGV